MKYIVLINTLFLNIIFSQNISGTIQNENEQTLEDVNVFIPILNKGTSSNSEGYFLLENLPNSSIEVHFTMVGYESETKIIKTNSSDLQIILKESVIKMEPIVVSGGFVNNQDKSAFKISSIEIDDLKFSGSPSLNLAIEKEPGIDIIKMGNSITKPVIRGLTGNRVMILYQGAKTSNQAWGEEHGVFIPEEGIEKVEIIKGPASLLYGSDAMGGIINYIPKRALIEDKRETKFSMSTFGNSGGYQTSLISQKKRKSWFHTYGIGYQNYGDYQTPNGNYAENSRYTHHYAFGNWGISKNWGILKGIYSSSYTLAGLIDTVSNEKGDRRLEEPWQKVGDHFVTTESTFWVYRWIIQPFVSYQLNHRKEFEGEHGHEEKENEEDHHHEEEHEESSLALDMSLRTSRFDLKSSFKQDSYDIALGFQGMYQTNTNYADEILVPDAITQDLGLYSFLNKKLGTLQIQMGARADNRIVEFNENKINFLNYTFSTGSTYNLNNQVYRFNFAKGFRAPNLYELSADGHHHGAHRYEKGNINLDSESNVEMDFSVHVHSHHFSMDMAAFNNNIQNYIYLAKTDLIIEDDPVYEHFQTDTNLKGGELGIDFHPHITDHTHFEITYSTVRGENLKLKEPLPMMPADCLKGEMVYEFPLMWDYYKISVKTNLDYYFKQENVAENEDLTNSYIISDIGLKVQKGSHELNFHIDNLLNTKYIPHLSLLKDLGIYEPGRNFVIKYSVKI